MSRVLVNSRWRSVDKGKCMEVEGEGVYIGLSGVNRGYVDKLVADIKSAINDVLSYSSKPYEG